MAAMTSRENLFLWCLLATTEVLPESSSTMFQNCQQISRFQDASTGSTSILMKMVLSRM